LSTIDRAGENTDAHVRLEGGQRHCVVLSKFHARNTTVRSRDAHVNFY